ncbi:putative RNA helicase SDE3 [Camellia lanceoleosa]|uniref:RNA helicase SDE3 n=1 Tax=Camellia lanceoleosa TaxID=1840588 RepID=A0ACC0IFT5_9ERIC|nr:putative RNA helicase SDE3 [Camellia lanceoleosa]
MMISPSLETAGKSDLLTLRTTDLCVLMTQMKRVRFLSPFHFPSYKESLCLFLLEKLLRIQLPYKTQVVNRWNSGESTFSVQIPQIRSLYPSLNHSVNSDADYIQGFLEGFSLEDRVLLPLQTQTIWLSCKPKDIGLHTSVVHFDVGDGRIEQVVFVLAEDKVSLSLASKKPYSRFPRRKQFATDESAKTKT